MMVMGLTQTLQALCSDALWGWKYAVLWSFPSHSHSHSHAVLTWADGYVNETIKATQVCRLHDDPNPIDSKNKVISSICCNNGQYQSLPLRPIDIEAAVQSMSTHSYYLGEGFIGNVAVTGQHCWISANELCSAFAHKYHQDWQLQFAAGIKTVLLVPVIPHGVLQLGSLDTVLESLTWVTTIKDLFYNLYSPTIPHNSSATGFAYSNTLRKRTATSADPPDVLPHDLFDLIKSSTQLSSIDHLSLPNRFTMSELTTLEDATIETYNTCLTACPDETLDANESDLWTNVHEEPSELTHCNTVFEPEIANLSFIDKFTYPDTKLSCRSVINIENPVCDNISGFTLKGIAQGYQEHTHGNAISLNDDAVTTNYLELDKDLEEMSREELKDFMWHGGLKQESSLLHGNKPEFSSPLENRDYTEFLLNAIMDLIDNTPNSESSHSTDSPVSCATQIQINDPPLRLDEFSVPEPPGGLELSPISISEGLMNSTMTVSSPSEINKIIIEECMGHTIQDVHRENSVDTKKVSRKIELHRPRPRDRQLIQDRMEELRELIPNASKCSIDALLDKTITHLRFLQCVSEKAEKLENKMHNGVPEPSDEIKKQLERCPLRVEALDQPGHLLIEMLCKEHHAFLEMAQVLKGLEVSILKGALEYRSHGHWARFVVEVASQGFNQMQILCPLMHLLQRR